MTKQYFYAQSTRYEINPETGEKELYLNVPLRVNPETVVDNKQKVALVKIGWKEYLCTYVWIPASYYIQYKRELESEAKGEERAHRCLIPDGMGGRIRCPEINRCSECKKCLCFNFDNGHNTSLNKLLDSGFNPESGTEFESDFDIDDGHLTPEQPILFKEEIGMFDAVSRDILTRLAAKKPKYGLIFGELLKGTVKPSEIARNTGLKANRTCEDLPKVRALAATIYKELIKVIDGED